MTLRRGVPATTTTRRLYYALAAAALLHVPLLPTALTAWISLLFSAPAMLDDEPDEPGEAILPIELDTGLFDDEPGEPSGDGVPPETAPAVAVEPPPPAEEEIAPDAFDDLDAGVPPSDEPEPQDEPPDAGAPDAEALAPDPLDAEPPDAEPPDAEPPPPAASAPEPVAEAADAGPPSARDGAIEDPAAVAGAGSIQSADPNVRLYLACELMRDKPAGQKFGRVLGAVPEWRALLGGTGLEAMRDFDHILLTGPQLRDGKDIVAVMDFNVSPTRMQNAVDAVVRKSGPKGRWLRGEPVPIAIVGAAGQRRVAVVREQRLAVIVPAKLEAKLLEQKSWRPFKKQADTLIGMFVVKPAKPMRKLGIEIPAREKWMRLRLSQAGDGFLLDIDFRAPNAGAAQEDLPKIAKAIEARRENPLSLFTKTYYFDEPAWTIKGPVIRGRARISSDQLDRVLGQVALLLSLDLK